MHHNPGPGKLIALEGLDGAGTTTQASLLANRLLHGHGIQVHVTSEPTPGVAGVLIRPFLAQRFTLDGRTVAALFAADRLDHLYSDRGVIERLQAGEWVVMDRYYLSSFAYQALTLSQKELRWLWHLHKPCLVPDVTFFLDVPPELCLQRIGISRAFHFELFETAMQLNQVRENYLDVIKRFSCLQQNIQVIDGKQSIENVTEIIQDRVKMMFLDDSFLTFDEQQHLWKQWPGLARLRKDIEQRLSLALVTVKKLPPSEDPKGSGGSKGGYQLEFGSPARLYHVAAFFTDYYRALRIRPLGKKDKVLDRLRETCPPEISRHPGAPQLSLLEVKNERSDSAGF